MKNVLLVYFVLFALFQSKSQSGDFNNHKKYWYYRAKLNNDFVKVGCSTGPSTGESLPFNQRARYANDLTFKSPQMGLGDGISTLGIYIGVLATEYRFLTNAHEDTRKVKHELFCALNAANRLDYYSEQALYGSCQPSLNGFLMRDDIPHNFVSDNYKHFNYYNSWDGVTQIVNSNGYNEPNTFQTDMGFATMAQQGVYETYTSYQSYADNNNSDKTAVRMSQDHVISLLYGLSLVNALVDDQAIDEFDNPYYTVTSQYQQYDPSAGTSLRKQAQEISKRLVYYVGKTSSWKIEDPCTHVYIGNVAGGDARIYAYGFAEAGCIAGGKGTSSLGCVGCSSIESCSDYHDWYTGSAGLTAWNVAANAPGTTPDVATQMAELSAACNCIYGTVLGHFISYVVQVLTKVWKWLGIFFGWVLQLVNTIITQFIPSTIYNETNVNMNANVGAWDLEHTSFARALIHNNIPTVDKPENRYNMPGLLDQAPCSGPWNLTDATSTQVIPNYPGWSISNPYGDGWEWSSDTRLEHPERRGDARKHPNGAFPRYDIFKGEYNGLDYMLYHNLWYLYRERAGLGGYDGENMQDRILTLGIPFQNGAGSQQQPIELDAFETIIANNTIGPNGDVTLRAGKWIHHTTNFHVSAGAKLHEYVEPFKCSFTGNYTRGIANNDTTLKHGSYDYLATDMGLVKTDFVNYPKEVIDFRPQTNSEITGSITQALNQPTSNYQEALVKAVVKSSIEDNSLSIFPNPSNGIFKIKIPVSDKSNSLNAWVYDLTGKLILTKENLKKWPDTENIDLGECTAGSYMVRIVTEEGKTYRARAIVK